MYIYIYTYICRRGMVEHAPTLQELLLRFARGAHGIRGRKSWASWHKSRAAGTAWLMDVSAPRHRAQRLEDVDAQLPRLNADTSDLPQRLSNKSGCMTESPDLRKAGQLFCLTWQEKQQQ